MIDDSAIDYEKEHDREHDARISRCFGLMKRTALRKANNEEVSAMQAMKQDGPFYCPSCLGDAIVRKCVDKVDHFAHRADQSPVLAKKDRALHELCKSYILKHLQQSFPEGKWAAEREIPENKAKGLKSVIPDISGRIRKEAVAIEIQASSYTINKIFTKLSEYEKRGVACLYIVPLKEPFAVKPFRPRLYEKYLHSIYSSRVYYWTEQNHHLLQAIHYSPAKRWIEENTWYDADMQEERTEGGFWLTYRTIKMPNINPSLFDIATDFKAVSKNSYEPKNVKKATPKCIVLKDAKHKWWDNNEYKDLKQQTAVAGNSLKTNFLSEYIYEDDYDDAFEYE